MGRILDGFKDWNSAGDGLILISKVRLKKRGQTIDRGVWRVLGAERPARGSKGV